MPIWTFITWCLTMNKNARFQMRLHKSLSHPGFFSEKWQCCCWRWIYWWQLANVCSNIDKAPRLIFILILYIVFVKFNQTANTGTAMLSNSNIRTLDKEFLLLSEPMKNFNPGIFRDGIFQYFLSRDFRKIFQGFSFLLHLLVKLDHFHKSLSSPSS